MQLVCCIELEGFLDVPRHHLHIPVPRFIGESGGLRVGRAAESPHVYRDILCAAADAACKGLVEQRNLHRSKPITVDRHASPHALNRDLSDLDPLRVDAQHLSWAHAAVALEEGARTEHVSNTFVEELGLDRPPKRLLSIDHLPAGKATGYEVQITLRVVKRRPCIIDDLSLLVHNWYGACALKELRNLIHLDDEPLTTPLHARLRPHRARAGILDGLRELGYLQEGLGRLARIRGGAIAGVRVHLEGR
mmetsp:Transcript_29201/g.72102  ORF Transcript_29201/g.72102 Transcript_29201/m.72102 type:complete len:249 (-) Transcript_29201:2041-2787(-)